MTMPASMVFEGAEGMTTGFTFFPAQPVSCSLTIRFPFSSSEGVEKKEQTYRDVVRNLISYKRAFTQRTLVKPHTHDLQTSHGTDPFASLVFSVFLCVTSQPCSSVLCLPEWVVLSLSFSQGRCLLW
jgi:hypothetical protein